MGPALPPTKIFLLNHPWVSPKWAAGSPLGLSLAFYTGMKAYSADVRRLGLVMVCPASLHTSAPDIRSVTAPTKMHDQMANVTDYAVHDLKVGL